MTLTCNTLFQRTGPSIIDKQDSCGPLRWEGTWPAHCVCHPSYLMARRTNDIDASHWRHSRVTFSKSTRKFSNGYLPRAWPMGGLWSQPSNPT